VSSSRERTSDEEAAKISSGARRVVVDFAVGRADSMDAAAMLETVVIVAFG